MKDYSDLGLDRNLKSLSSFAYRADRIENSPGGIVKASVDEIEDRHGHEGRFVPSHALSWGNSPRGTEGLYGIFVGKGVVGVGKPSSGAKLQVSGINPTLGTQVVGLAVEQYDSSFGAIQTFVYKLGTPTYQLWDLNAGGSMTWGAGRQYQSTVQPIFTGKG